MPVKQYDEADTLNREVRDHGLTGALYHHVKRARDAGNLMKVAISAEHQFSLIAEAQKMIEEVDRAYKILSNDSTTPKESEE